MSEDEKRTLGSAESSKKTGETLSQEDISRLTSLYARWVNPYEICLIIDADGTRSWRLIEHKRKEIP